MHKDEGVAEFRALEAKLFERVPAGFTTFKTRTGRIGINWKHDGPLLDTLGLMTVLEEEIARDFLSADGKPVGVDREDEIFQADLDLTTTAALRDELCGFFPTVVIGYLLPNQVRGNPEIKRRCNRSDKAEYHCHDSPLQLGLKHLARDTSKASNPWFHPGIWHIGDERTILYFITEADRDYVARSLRSLPDWPPPVTL